MGLCAPNAKEHPQRFWRPLRSAQLERIAYSRLKDKLVRRWSVRSRALLDPVTRHMCLTCDGVLLLLSSAAGQWRSSSPETLAAFLQAHSTSTGGGS
jgi:hypothetical protein